MLERHGKTWKAYLSDLSLLWESLRPGWILRRSSAGHPNSGGTTSTEAWVSIPTAFREPFQLHRTHFSQVLEMGEMVTEALTYLTIFGKSAQSTFQIVSIVESSLLRGYEALLSIAEAVAKERKSLLKSQGNSETEGMAQEWCRNAAKLVGIILRWSKNHQTWGIYNWSIRIWISMDGIGALAQPSISWFQSC